MQSSFPQSNTPQIRRAGVDLNGVMSVLSKHLYSTPTVALRELVQNATTRSSVAAWSSPTGKGRRESR